MECKVISLFDVFELNRVLHKLLGQQSSYNIQTAFKIYNLIKWLDETEGFVFERINNVFGNDTIDLENPIHQALLSSQVPFCQTTLCVEELLKTDGEVKIEVTDVEILEKMLGKTED